MSGSFVDANEESKAADIAMAAAEVAPALAFAEAIQSAAARFIAESGAEVIGGHSPVGDQGGLDLEPPSSDPGSG
jgi:hypothetical protein